MQMKYIKVWYNFISASLFVVPSCNLVYMFGRHLDFEVNIFRRVPFVLEKEKHKSTEDKSKAASGSYILTKGLEHTALSFLSEVMKKVKRERRCTARAKLIKLRVLWLHRPQRGLHECG